MNPEELVGQAERIISSRQSGLIKLTEAQEFLRVYAGENSSFFRQIRDLGPRGDNRYLAQLAENSLNAFIEYVRHGLLDGVSIERQAKIDIVSDFLEQAQNLLLEDDIHPVAPSMIIGASLEEFLRNWVEDADLNIQGKPSIDTYAKALRGDELITKQDIKDITSWAGLRNHAAHGEWDEVSNKERIGVMLESVNLFMRKYGAG